MFLRSEPQIDFIIVGLGNPGAKYDKTRHNAGFNAIDYISGKSGIEIKKLKHMALVGKGTIAGKKVLLMKPQTYMNESGNAVSDAMRFYKVSPEHVLVIQDDVALPPAKLRIRRNGSDGGHNGIKSVIEHLGTNEFPRIKIGVGEKPHPDYDLADWVLGDIPAADRAAIADKYDAIFKATEFIVNGEAEKAMQQFN